MEFFAKLESWDYLAGIIVVISLWLITFGINKLHAANPQLVDVAKLRMRAYGALIASLAYFVCKKLA